jgi:dihydroorotate dehydrogenase electron transfer subunit
MSVYAYCQTGREISFLYKVVGAGTNALADLKPRELLNIVGPLGNGFAIRPEWQRPLLLARGVGLATLVPLAQKLSAINRPLVVICSARSPELLMSTEIFRQYGAEVITVTDTEGSSSIESLTHLIDRIIQRHDIDVFYTCGSKRLVHLLQKFGALYGISGQVALEQQMACGIGMCQACVVSCRRDDRVVSLRVCRDGPVFDLQEAS